MTEPAPQNQMSLVSPQNQHQGSPASTLNCDDIRQINDMVDPALLDLLRQEQEQPAQPELPVWPVNGGGVLILAPVEEPAPPEQQPPAKPDILGVLVDQLLNV